MFEDNLSFFPSRPKGEKSCLLFANEGCNYALSVRDKTMHDILFIDNKNEMRFAFYFLRNKNDKTYDWNQDERHKPFCAAFAAGASP